MLDLCNKARHKVAMVNAEDVWIDETDYSVKPEIVSFYKSEGYIVIKNFFSNEDLRPVIKDIEGLTRLQLEQTGSAGGNSVGQNILEEGILKLAGEARWRVGAIYDASMKLLSTRALPLMPKAVRLVNQLLGSDLVAMSNNIIVRVDLPQEDAYLFDHWHQDYPYSMVADHGCVFWIPLNHITKDVGPVQILPGSHKQGLQRVIINEKQRMTVADDEFLFRFENLSEEVELGDLIVFDLLLVHRSARNVSKTPRWTVTYRFCDMKSPTSVTKGWPCFYKQGRHFVDVYPDLVIKIG